MKFFSGNKIYFSGDDIYFPGMEYVVNSSSIEGKWYFVKSKHAKCQKNLTLNQRNKKIFVFLNCKFEFHFAGLLYNIINASKK